MRRLLHYTMLLLTFLRITRFHNEPSGAPPRTMSVWNEGKKRGIRLRHVTLFGIDIDFSAAWLPIDASGKKFYWYYFESIPIPPWLDSRPVRSIDDKQAFKKLFTDALLPVARGFSTWSEKDAERAFYALGAPVITKPREGSRARHTTVAIDSVEGVRAGYRLAAQLSPVVMVEEYVPGILYRATCVNNTLIGVIQFVRPSICADGSMTVSELLKYHNAHKKYAHLTDVEDDWWFEMSIQHQGYTRDSIPEKGVTLWLSEHSERPNGGYFIDVTDMVPGAHKQLIEKAARVAHRPVIGFDIISRDLTKPDEKMTFIEGNTLPFIEIHDIPYEGSPRNVSAAVWDLWNI